MVGVAVLWGEERNKRLNNLASMIPRSSPPAPMVDGVSSSDYLQQQQQQQQVSQPQQQQRQQQRQQIGSCGSAGGGAVESERIERFNVLADMIPGLSWLASAVDGVSHSDDHQQKQLQQEEQQEQQQQQQQQ